MGLDPGIDHMSAMSLIRTVRADGGRIVSFCSYGSGIPAPGQPHNPLRYVMTSSSPAICVLFSLAFLQLNLLCSLFS